MNIYPYRSRPKHKAIGLVVPTESGGVVVDFEDESRPASALATDHLDNVPRNTAVYIDSMLARSYLRMGIGEALYTNRAMTRYIVNHRTLYPIPHDIGPSLLDLIQWRDWVETTGGSVRSKTGTAVTILRANLDRPLKTGKGDGYPPLDKIVGGRIHGTGFAMHPEIEVWDISAAYATTLANLRIDGVWKEAPFDIDSERFQQFADVTIRVPSLRWGPLPEQANYPTRGLWWDVFGEREFPISTTFRGLWTATELRSAVNAGSQIKKVHSSSRLFASNRQPFSAWWGAIMEGRKLNGKAGTLAKITGNVLWGIFAPTKGKRMLVRYGPGRKRIVTPLPDAKATTLHADYALAELVTSTIRAKVYDELIIAGGDNLISVCVDGGLTKPGFVPPGEGWRKKDSGTECAFLKPFVYAYRRPSGERVFKMAGIQADKREDAFTTLRQAYFNLSAAYFGRSVSQRERAVYRIMDAFNGSCIEKPEEISEVDRYFGTLITERGENA